MKIKSEAKMEESVPSFLLEGISLSDADKLQHFEELQKLCEEMEEKVSCYQRRCDYVQGKIKMSEQNKSRKKKKSAVSKAYNPKMDSDLFELIEEDETIPVGWRSAWRALEGFSKGGRVKVFWEPNGKYCPSRVNALNQMITVLDSSTE